MSVYKNYSTDKVKEVQGAPLELEPNDNGTVPTFYLARSAKSNPDWSKAFDAATKEFKAKIRLKQMTNDDWEKVGKQVFLNSVLKGWQHVEGPDGSVLEYNAANAKQLIDDLPELYERLNEFAGDVQNYRAELIEQSKGN